MNILNTFNFTINSGYNKLILPSPILINKGTLIYLTQNSSLSSGISIDQTGNSTYSDMIWGTTIQKLNNNIEYGKTTIFTTRYGTFGYKLWVLKDIN